MAKWRTCEKLQVLNLFFGGGAEHRARLEKGRHGTAAAGRGAQGCRRGGKLGLIT